jgi:hypothetical protein
MAILEINMTDVSWLDPAALERSIKQSRAVRITMEVPGLYRAESKTALAQNWLKVWYISECFAKHAAQVECTFHEGDLGAGVVVLQLVIRDMAAFVTQVLEFGPVFDPDELEAPALIYDEAEDWLDKRGGSPAALTELEKCYRDDAEAASDEEGYRGDNCNSEEEID